MAGARAEIARAEAERHPLLTLRQGWGAYLNASNRPDSGPATLVQYEYQFDALVRWAATRKGVETFADVTPDVARDYAEHLAKTVSPATFNKHLSLPSLVWRTLAKPARVAVNPWAESEINRKVAVPQSRRELTVAELRRLCGEATGELRTLLAVGLYSGLRLGDAATLRWEEADLDRREIRRVPNKTARRNPWPVIVPIHPTLAAMLGELPEPRVGFVMPGMAARTRIAATSSRTSCSGISPPAASRPPSPASGARPAGAPSSRPAFTAYGIRLSAYAVPLTCRYPFDIL